ncbi:RICIN domain-containing protein [Phascolarctobacterium succinatutens]|uniref:RICIN domain-containing protein n=1 Tax=Phascolarctobacterium succinatutens TaxID=626940 RepID=UPI00307A2BAF
MKNNKKILALLTTMLISGSMEVYASGLNITTANPNANIYNARTGGYNYNTNEANASAKVAQPREVLNVLIANPIKSQIPVYTSLTSGKIARYFNVNEVGYCESNAYFLDVYVYSNGFAQVTYFNKQNKDTKIYVKASDLSAGQNILRVDSLAVKTATAPMPLYTDASKSKVMYTMGKGRTYKILAQQGSMQQVYSYGKRQYRAIGWINASSTMSSTISSTGLKGDVNGDGNVSSDDLKLLEQYLRNSAIAINKKDADMNNDGIINYVDYNLLVYFLNPPKPILKGDVNRDGKIDEADYKLLSQYVAGLKVSGFYHYNADMNDDKKFTSTDLSQLRTKLNSMKPPVTENYTVVNIQNGWYEIAPLANERMRLDVDGAREGNEVNIKLYNSNGNVAQRFYVNNVGNGYFTLRTGCNGYVDLCFGQTSNGSNIWQYEKEAANGKCQKFRAIRRNNDAGVFIEPLAKEGIAVACANNSAAAQTNVVVWSRENNNYQKWRFIQTSAAPVPVNVDNGLYSIQPQCAPNSELTVLNASKDHSTPVVIYSKNSQNQRQKSHQKWQVTKLNNGYYKITAENSGLALNNHNGSNANGNPITLWDYSGFCQEFRFLDAGNGYYIIQPKNVNGVLDVSGGSSANNTKIQLFQYNGSAAQKWKLERREPGEDERYNEWREWPKRNCDVFENANLTVKKGRVDTADSVTVFEETGSSYHIRYKTNSGGMKEGWVTRDIFKKANWEEMFEKSLKLHPQHSYWQGEAFGAWECHGFALMIANEISGDNPRNWRKVYGNNALNSLKSGDIIRTGDNSDHKGGHSMVVLYVDGNNIHVVHSNVHNNPKKGWHHRTYWDETYSKSAIINWNANGFNYVIKYPY